MLFSVFCHVGLDILVYSVVQFVRDLVMVFLFVFYLVLPLVYSCFSASVCSSVFLCLLVLSFGPFVGPLYSCFILFFVVSSAFLCVLCGVCSAVVVFFFFI